MVDPKLLRRCLSAATATDICRQLGQASGYMLNDRALAAAGLEPVRPALSACIGGCRPLIGVRDPEWRQFLLPAFFLPLQWLEGEPDDLRVPPGILDCARNVRESTQQSQERSFGLGFQDRHMPWPDLRQFDAQHLDGPSSFSALAAGLYSAVTSFAADTGVWASSVWTDRFESVDLLAEKVDTARRWGAEKFFVAPSQDVSALPASAAGILERLGRQTVEGPQRAMAPLLAASILEPHEDEADECYRYHRSVREIDHDKAVDFYQRILIHHILKKCRETLRRSPSVAGIPEGGSMITIATRQTQPVPILVGSLGIKRLLVLYTTKPNGDSGVDDMSEAAVQIASACGEMFSDVEIDPQSFDYDPNSESFPVDFLKDLQSKINEFASGVPSGELVFDIDRGLTMHKIALLQHVIRPDHLLATLAHDFEGPGKIRHGSEQIFVWRAGDDWSSPFRLWDPGPAADLGKEQEIAQADVTC